jgi:putative oxygen-independent coproporphyrinogen III oxidase
MTAGFGIYVHWPFCLSKCPYCDFNSHVAAVVDHGRWRVALLAELEHFAAQTPARSVDSVFFGGGTPSLMDPATAAALVERVRALWPAAPELEVTLEANPGTVDAARFEAFRAAGINRLSMGIQALNDADLRFLGRRHDLGEALAAIELARRVFPRISFDLIYARPGQDEAAWTGELRRALDLAADHLSLYQLTIEEGTAFHPAHARGDFVLPDDDRAARLYEATQEVCAAAGLPAYEVSNHARPGAECRHNLVYWRGGEWIGVGPGAHGRLLLDGAVTALRQHRAPQVWLERVERDGHATVDRTPLDAAERVEELVMMGLRLAEGLNEARFAAQTGRSLRAALDPDGLAAMEEGGFLAWEDGALRATPAGRLLLNRVTATLLGA